MPSRAQFIPFRYYTWLSRYDGTFGVHFFKAFLKVDLKVKLSSENQCAHRSNIEVAPFARAYF